MTDLLNRPTAGPPSGAVEPPLTQRILPALLAAGASLLTGVLACAAVAVLGWLAATSGGATGAVRAGAMTWLVAHKAAATVGAGSFGLAPLGLTLIAGLLLYRAGRFAARVSAADRVRDLVTVALALSTSYAAGLALVAVLVSDGTARVSPAAAFLGGGTLALLFGTAGMLAESGAGEDLVDALPDWFRDALPAALAAAGIVLAVAALLVAISLLAHFTRSTDLLTALDPGVIGALVLLVICVLLLPNAIAYAVSFLAGPGFQLGTGTAVAPTGVELGNLPALPLLAALPSDGATPAYLLGLTAVIPVLGGVAAGLVLSRREVVSQPVLSAGVAAVIAGIGLFMLMALAGGAAGPGRMADVGVPAALPAAAVLAVGFALGAVPTTILAGRR